MPHTVVSLGELMMRLTPPQKLRLRQANQFDICHGGAEANVANALANFGLNSRFISALPATELGTQALMTLRANGVNTDFVYRTPGRMGIYFMEEGADYRSGCVIYDRMDTAFAALDPDTVDWDHAFSKADWFHISGITPAISENTLRLTERSLREARERNVHVSMDLNYRERLWDYGIDPLEVVPAMVEQVNTLIAGRGDCQPCLGIDGDEENGSHAWATSLAGKLKNRFHNLSSVAITVRNSTTADQHDWYALLQKGDNTVFSRAYSMQNVVDRVGTGDAFGAGLIYGLLTKSRPEDAVGFAAAANCLKHTIVGDANCVTVDEVEALANSTFFGRLKR